MRDETPDDALLLVSFGGPEGPDDVLPFLEGTACAEGSPGPLAPGSTIVPE